jgi:periplasmic divalent cation tolerance protein
MSNEYIFIYVTIPDEIIAKDIGKGLIEKKIATCVNIMSKSQAFYMWEGRIEESHEYIMIIKTLDAKFTEIENFILTLHPHKCPCIIALSIIDGHQNFLNWIKEGIK